MPGVIEPRSLRQPNFADDLGPQLKRRAAIPPDLVGEIPAMPLDLVRATSRQLPRNVCEPDWLVTALAQSKYRGIYPVWKTDWFWTADWASPPPSLTGSDDRLNAPVGRKPHERNGNIECDRDPWLNKSKPNRHGVNREGKLGFQIASDSTCQSKSAPLAVMSIRSSNR